MHPYKNLPVHSSWRKSISEVYWQDIDPVVSPKFKIRDTDRVATAGSCFAQHIARHLSNVGMTYFVTETSHPIFNRTGGKYNYGTYTARYGNLYTARQLKQLLLRAYGLFNPVEYIWERGSSYIDAFRPEIQPGGFATLAEFHADRTQHYTAVRSMVENLDYFVFTLGLTETWLSKQDGAVFPICPGVAGGTFSEETHEFRNFSVEDIVSDLKDAFDFIRARNEKAKFILTVSPVPLKATAEPRNVLLSTVLSKSCLRVAADIVSSCSDNVEYFPSYEIITGPHAGGRYFGQDLRSVTEDGVSHVMRVFLKNYTDKKPNAAQSNWNDAEKEDRNSLDRKMLSELVKVVCEEDLLDQNDEIERKNFA